MKKIVLTYEILFDLYITQNLGYRDIAPILGVSNNTVRRRLVDLNIIKSSENIGKAISAAKAGKKYGSQAERRVVNGIEEKYCTKCETFHPVDSYHVWSYGADGLANICKYCENLRQKTTQWKTVKNTRQKTIRLDPIEKLKHNFSNYMQQCIKSNKAGMKWEIFVPYDCDQLRAHLEFGFKDDMSWDNMGRNGWHIDHIIPLKYKLPNNEFYFNQIELSDPTTETFKKAWALNNLQPSWELDNIKKSNKFIG